MIEGQINRDFWRDDLIAGGSRLTGRVSLVAEGGTDVEPHR
jgi:hypothetical protein